MLKYLLASNRIFYFLLLATFLFVLFSHPFLKYPYDMWVLLIRIDDVYSIDKIANHRRLWYLFWAEIFHLFSINDFFIRARVIHVVQTIICLSSVFMFSRVLIRNIFKKLDSKLLNYLSYWSVIVWLTIFSTFSMYTHQVWIMWYSLTYQIALAFFWYITALTLILAFEKKSGVIKLFYCIQIVFFSSVILAIHKMEIIYYFMYLVVLCIVFFDKIKSFIREKFYTVFPIFIITVIFLYVFFSYFYQYEGRIPNLFIYLYDGEYNALYINLMSRGKVLVNGHNRAFSSINELMIIAVFMGGGVLLCIIKDKILTSNTNVNLRVFLFLLISSSFVSIPLSQFTAGFAAFTFHMNVVNRVYYSSSLYVLVPIGVYYIWNRYSNKVSLYKINASMIAILFITLLFSWFVSNSNNYYKNVKSLVDSFDESKVGFVLSQDNIKTIGKMLDEYEKNLLVEGKKVIYFARSDINLILKYVYKRDVYMDFAWNGKGNRRTFEQFEAYSKNKKVLQEKIPIVFETPKSFPEYVPYK